MNYANRIGLVMKRLIILVLAIQLLGLATSIPASAIFGFSKCDKVKNQILKEEDYGRALHNKLEKVRGVILEKNFLATGYDAVVFANALEPLLNSTIKVYVLAQENQKCFSAKKIDLIVAKRIRFRDDLTAITKILNDYTNKSGYTIDYKGASFSEITGMDNVKTYFLKYVSVYKLK